MVEKCWAVKTKNDPMVIPSYETISFTLPTMESWEDLLSGKEPGWVYLSDGNPTLAALETLLAKLQGTETCWVTSTGKSAIAATLLALLQKDDHLILLKEGYKSTRLFSEGILQKFGVDITMVGIDELDSLASLIKPGKTRVIMLESPTNPMTRDINMKKCVAIAKEHNIHTILDNSCAGFHQHGDVPVDVIVHSLSKFASGVGDVMGGAVMGSKELVKQIKNANVWNSDVLASDSALQIWKSMQTYELRTTRQSQNALAIARFLEAHPQVERVLYPGLASHPDHGIAKTQMKDFGCVIAFDVAGGEKAMRKVLNSLNCFNIAFGTGFTQSIANPAWLFYARSFPEAQEGKSAINHNTIRLSVGIEPEAELLADLEQALA